MGGKKNSMWDSIIPIGLSTIEILFLFFIFLIYWGMGHYRDIELLIIALFTIVVSYVIMFHGLKYDRKKRILLFPKLGLVAIIIGVSAFFLSDTIGLRYWGDMLGNVAFFTGTVACLGLGYTVGSFFYF